MIEITEKNYKQIFGRVKKFFKGYKAFETWSSYDCGGHKRIPHTFKMDGKVYDTKISIQQVTIYDKTDFVGVQYFSDSLECGNYYFLEIGDEISFNGNRITVKKKDYGEFHYRYTTFQSIGFDQLFRW